VRKKGTEDGQISITHGSGNVFADIGIPEPEEALAKARLADLIGEAIEQRGLTQALAGEFLGIDQGTVSKLVNGRLDGISQERLIRYLNALGNDVEIIVRRSARYGHRGSLTVASG
jgi:predicted XRE-type DNA-binding protein